MIQRQLNYFGDWTFGKGKGNYARGAAAINLSLQTRLQSFKNDCFFDKSAGIDWINYMLAGNVEGLKQEIRKVVIETNGITGLNSLEVNADSSVRKITWTIDFKTIYSQSNITKDSVDV